MYQDFDKPMMKPNLNTMNPCLLACAGIPVQFINLYAFNVLIILKGKENESDLFFNCIDFHDKFFSV